MLIQDVDFALAAGGERAIDADDILTVPGVVEGVQEEDGGKQVLVEVGRLETLPLVGARQLLGTLLDTLSTWSQNIVTQGKVQVHVTFTSFSGTETTL